LGRDPTGALRAQGVRLYRGRDREPFEVHATREVVLAAGAIGSPQLLQLSGIADPDRLSALGVAPVHALRGVGENLQDHLQIRSIWRVENTVTLNRRARTLWGKALMGLEYLMFRTGPLTMPPSQLGAFARSADDVASADMEWHVQPLSLDRFGAPLHPWDAITPSVCNLRPSSRGSVWIRSADPLATPAIRPNYLSTEHDARIAVAGLRFTRHIMAAPPLARFRPREDKPGPEIQDDAALLDAARELGTTIFHPVGTCRMGQDDRAVVDDRLRVYGISGLRVVDASIMPTITSGNTNAPTVMIAERGAAFMLEDARAN
jgi:choline dehydrogenase